MKVAVFTSSRADFGILSPLLEVIQDLTTIELSLFVSGTHLSSEFENTVNEIDNERYHVRWRVPIWSDDDSYEGLTKDIGSAVTTYSQNLLIDPPDLLIVLGDRLETLAIAIACMILDIPVGHIHGGELTLGAMDDRIRHCISKIAIIHFASHASHARRLIQMGENKESVYNVGALAIDNISKVPIKNRSELAEISSHGFSKEYALLTYHPSIYEDLTPGKVAEHILDSLLASTDLSIIITSTNNDLGNSIIRETYGRYRMNNPNRIFEVGSLGMQNYISALKNAELCIGNSSSLVIEAPALGVPVVLVGNRQAGRPLSSNILPTGTSCSEISKSIEVAMGDDFKLKCEASLHSEFSQPGAAMKIAEIIENLEIPINTFKRFTDIDPLVGFYE